MHLGPKPDLLTPVLSIRRSSCIVALAFAVCVSVVRADDRPLFLYEAVRTGDLETVRAMIEKDRALLESLPHNKPPLAWAVRNGEIEVARYLLEQGAKVDRIIDGEPMLRLHDVDDPNLLRLLIRHGLKVEDTALQAAAASGNAEVVKVLIEAGAKLDLDSAIWLGWNDQVAAMLKEKPWLAKYPNLSLITAARTDNLQIAKVLLDHGADPNQRHRSGGSVSEWSPLALACREKNYELAELLLQRGATPDVMGFFGKAPVRLIHEAVNEMDVRFVRLLLEHGADPNDPRNDGFSHPTTPMHQLAITGDIEKAKLLLEFGADVNLPATDGATALHYALFAHKEPMVEFLLANQAAVDFFAAAALGRTDMVREYLKKNPVLAKTTDRHFKRTALHWSADRGYVNVVSVMLTAGADIDAKAPHLEHNNPDVWENGQRMVTALYMATARGHREIVELLLAHGADLDSKFTDSNTPLHIAARNNDVVLAKLLLDRGANVNAKGESDWTPLYHAVISQEMTELLVNAGAEINVSSEGDSPLSEAVDAGRRDTATWLISRGGEADGEVACVLGLTDRLGSLVKKDPAVLQTKIPYRGMLLDVAAMSGQLESVKTLLANGATPTPYGGDDIFSTTIAKAAMAGHPLIVEYLLEHPPYVDHRREMISHLLYPAAIAAQPKVVEYLIENGADVRTRLAGRGTPLHAAADAYAGYSYARRPTTQEVNTRTRQTIEQLLAAGADAQARDNDRRTPLHDAAEAGHSIAVETLLAAGADVNARDNHNQTPLSLAMEEANADFGETDYAKVIELLRQHGGIR